MPPSLLTMSKYACAPSNASPYPPPSGLVTDTTPPTRIAVSVTPGASTGTCSPGLLSPGMVSPSPPFAPFSSTGGLDPGVAVSADLPQSLPQAAPSNRRTAVAAAPRLRAPGPSDPPKPDPRGTPHTPGKPKG